MRTASNLRASRGGIFEGCTGLAILDTAGPLYNLHYLNALGSPRSPHQRKFSDALMHRKIPLPRGWKRRVRSSVLHILAVGHHAATCPIRRRTCCFWGVQYR